MQSRNDTVVGDKRVAQKKEIGGLEVEENSSIIMELQTLFKDSVGMGADSCYCQ